MITTIALIGSVVGAWLIAKQKKSGFYAWIVANALWLIDSVSRGDLQQSLLWIYYEITCVIGIFVWKEPK